MLTVNKESIKNQDNVFIGVDSNKIIINLTNHYCTEDQKAEGIFDPEDEDKDAVKKLITFENIPTYNDMAYRSRKIVDIVNKYNVNAAMIGGASYFMPILTNMLKMYNIRVCCSFTIRKVEEKEVNGTIVKKSYFKHQGLVWI